MGFSIQYKRLFECQIRHGFYLNKGRILEDYDLENNRRYNIQTDLLVEPSADTARFLKRHRMRIRNQPSGWAVLLRVKEGYQPFIPLPSDFTMTFYLKPRNSHWSDITNARLRPNFPTIFYFTNDQPLATLTYPHLHMPLLYYYSGRAYEMGELARTGNAVYMAPRHIREDKPPGTRGSRWQRIAYFQEGKYLQFASYRDRLLAPSRFHYFFDPIEGDQVRDGRCTVKRQDEVVKEVDFSSDEDMDRLWLDLSDLAAGFYWLEIKSNQGYRDVKYLFISDRLYDRQAFGVVQIRHRAGLEEFRLLDEHGAVLGRDGSEAPRFRITLKNRYTYWQYVLAEGQKPDPASTSEVQFYDPAETRLITKTPMPLTRAPGQVLYRRDSSSTSEIDERIILPDPSDLLVRTDEAGRLFNEIYLSKHKDI